MCQPLVLVCTLPHHSPRACQPHSTRPCLGGWPWAAGRQACRPARPLSPQCPSRGPACTCPCGSSDPRHTSCTTCQAHAAPAENGLQPSSGVLAEQGGAGYQRDAPGVQAGELWQAGVGMEQAAWWKQVCMHRGRGCHSCHWVAQHGQHKGCQLLQAILSKCFSKVARCMLRNTARGAAASPVG